MNVHTMIKSTGKYIVTPLLALSLASFCPNVLGANGNGGGKKQSKQQTAAAAAAESTASFSGEAKVVSFTEVGTADTIVIGATGPLLSAGGSLGATVSATNLLSNVLTEALSLQSAQALTVGANDQTLSEVTMNDFSVTIMAANGTLHTISFDSLGVAAKAQATAAGAVTTGSTTISGLVIDNVAVAVTGQANQVVPISGGLVIINAQTNSVSGNSGEIMVAGLFIWLENCLNGPIGFAQAGISFEGAPPPPPANTLSFSGEASLVSLTDTTTGQTLTLGTTGPLLSTGGNLAVNVGATTLLSNLITAGLSLQSGQTLTAGAQNQTHSESAINNFSITLLGANGVPHTISFASLRVEANAQATATGVVTTGSTIISGLLIDNMAVTVTGEANQVVPLSGGGTVTINAQTRAGTGNAGEISVSGLFVSLPGGVSGPIGFARAGMNFTGTPPPPPPSTISFAGEAAVATLINTCTGQRVTIGGTGPLLSVGGSLATTIGATNLVNPLLGSLSLQSGAALTASAQSQTHSEATVSNFSLTVTGTSGVPHTITFTSVRVEANAQATASGVVSSGNTIITGLVIDNVPVTVTGEANQTVALSGGGTVVINAQSRSGTGNQGGITVEGLRISLDGCLVASIGVASAAVSSAGQPPSQPPPCDKITGGGFIFATAGAKGTFGVSGGIRRGQFWGHLNYIDHGIGMHVRSTRVTGYSIVNANTRRIDYLVNVDGAAGACTVIVTDNGEPGRNDLFDITVSNGYHAGGDLGGSGSGGGNIQLHKCPPGWRR